MTDSTRLCSPALLHAGARIAARSMAAWEDRHASTGAPPTDEDALDLYDGPWGPTLFWAAMAATSPEDAAEARDRCRIRLTPLRARVNSWSDAGSTLDGLDRAGEDAIGITIGGLFGLGATIYALTTLGVLLDDVSLLDEARAVASLITEDRIHADRHLDLVHGAAGALLALLALDNVRTRKHLGCGDEGLREKARWCGEHLLGQRQPYAPGMRVWRAPKPPHSGDFQSGFAHGAAGIRFALLRLAAIDPDPRLLEAARESTAFEAKLRVPEKRCWRPFAAADPQSHMLTAWCWGGPGIALSHLAALDTLDEAATRDTIEVALEATVELAPTLEDHLCCGNLGRAMVLADAPTHAGAGDTPRRDLVRAADRIAYDVLRRAKHRGGFGWPPHTNVHEDPPSLLKGIAGVGYGFLYLGHPRQLPMVLRLQPPPG